MPTYAYRCNACGHAFDIHQSFSEDSLTVCPECDGQLRKVFGAVGVTFNGSGFYRTDSRASASEKKGAGEKKGADAGGSGSDSSPKAPAKTESKASPASSGS